MKFTPIVFAICAFAASNAVASPIPANTDCVRYCRPFWGVCSVKLCGNGWQLCLDHCNASQLSTQSLIPVDPPLTQTQANVIPTETQSLISVDPPITITLTDAIPTETQSKSGLQLQRN